MTTYLATIVLALSFLAAPALAQSNRQPAHDHAAPAPAPQEKARQGGMMAHEHQQMMTDLAARQTRLEQLVATMNTAVGEAKIDAIAALLTQLVSDMKGEQQHHMEMHAGMASHK
jgi:hypothetical protein